VRRKKAGLKYYECEEGMKLLKVQSLEAEEIQEFK
jgi:hypothetical protein